MFYYEFIFNCVREWKREKGRELERKRSRENSGRISVVIYFRSWGKCWFGDDVMLTCTIWDYIQSVLIFLKADQVFYLVFCCSQINYYLMPVLVGGVYLVHSRVWSYWRALYLSRGSVTTSIFNKLDTFLFCLLLFPFPPSRLLLFLPLLYFPFFLYSFFSHPKTT